jgi:hypothetical protein
MLTWLEFYNSTMFLVHTIREGQTLRRRGLRVPAPVPQNAGSKPLAHS